MKNTVTFFPFKKSTHQLLDTFKHAGLFGTHDKRSPRIPPDEIERLNEHIKSMNSEGWNIQSTQSIETGVYGKERDFGSSFTDGVIIYWEKE